MVKSVLVFRKGKKMTDYTFAEICSKLSQGSFESRFLYFMRMCGIDKVDVEYSGGGDSGCIDNVVVHSETLEESVLNELTKDLLKNADDDLGSYIWNRHGSFADGGGYYVSGKVVYALGLDNESHDQIYMEGTDYETEYGDWDEEKEEYEYEEENETEWHEPCWMREEGSTYEANNFSWGKAPKATNLSLLIKYAKLKYKEVPEEIHNVILTAATMGDEAAKDYIKNKE